MKIIIIDDEPLAIDILVKYAESIDYIEILNTFTNPIEAIKFIADNEVDLIFLDIEMPMLNGVDLVESLNSKPSVIFTTAFPNYAVEGFNLDAIDYLLKPISYKRFLKAISKISQNSSKENSTIPSNQLSSFNNENKYVFVKSDYENIKVNVSEIKYIEGLKDYLRINLSNGKFVLTLSNFSNILEKIDNPNFIRIHNSYIINLDFVKSIQKNRVLIDDKRIPISETYKKDFFDKIKLH